MKEKIKSFFTETISFESPLSFDKVKAIIKSGTSEADAFFDENIMFGTIIVDKIDAKINHSDFLNLNPRTQVKGTITEYKGHTFIHLRVKPNQFALPFIVICAFFALLPISTGEGFLNDIIIILIPLIVLAILISVIKLKLTKDRQKLEKWLKEKIGYLPKQTL